MKNVTVRRSAPGDESALARLASLDSASPPRGPALIAEADSRMLAALPLGSGRAIADPFEPTADLVGLLELRRAQIEAAQGAATANRPAALAAARPALARPRVSAGPNGRTERSAPPRNAAPRGSNLPSPLAIGAGPSPGPAPFAGV